MKLLKNVHVLENNRQVRKEILFDETGILKIAEQIDAPEAEVIDGKEMTALPGLIDVSSTQLRELLARPGRVFTREMLLARLWGYDFYGDERVVDSHIKNLRRKLERDYIETVRGVGYRAAKESR